MSVQKVSEKYLVSTNCIRDLRRLREETGQLAPRQAKPGPKPKLSEHREQLAELVEAQPDATLEELQQRLPVQVGLSTIWRELLQLGITLKKVLHAAEQQRPNVQQRRTCWYFWRAVLDYRRLVFLDETSANTRMTRRFGRTWRGQRLIAHVPHGPWRTTTFAPALRPGDLVILDNLSAHKVAGVREAVAAVEAQVIYLPPYSPDLNPIELAFAKLKSLLRKAAARTVGELENAIGTLLDQFHSQECRNYFEYAGYLTRT